MNIAVFGGSFNPIHKGHIKLIEEARKLIDIDKVLLIPTGVTPHKSNNEMVSSNHRLNMCRLATDSYSYISVSDIEIKRQGKSYTYLTLNSLKEIYPNDTIYLIMGADMFLSLQTWKNAEELLNGLNVITCLRDETSYTELLNQAEALKEYKTTSYIIKKNVMDVSSTDVRYKLKNNINISQLIDEKVANYIAENNLYRK